MFGDLVDYVEQGHIRPIVAKIYPLEQIRQAQEDFLGKRHTGKLVLVPPSVDTAYSEPMVSIPRRVDPYVHETNIVVSRLRANHGRSLN